MNNILITGTSSGLGLSLANAFKESGYNVYGISRSKTRLGIKQIQCDFNNLDKVKSSIIELVDIKDFDYVILNAGMLGRLDKQCNLSINDYNEIFNVNVLSNKVILDFLMKECNIKNVIGISSGAALKTYFGWSLYCSSKAAFKQLISSYSDEFPDTRFLSLAPGIIKTKMQHNICNEDEGRIPSIKKFKKMYSTMDTPEYVANKIFNNLDKLNSINSGEYLDMREY
jgi:benzil reductase ((S)-benzoin forming)